MSISTCESPWPCTFPPPRRHNHSHIVHTRCSHPFWPAPTPPARIRLNLVGSPLPLELSFSLEIQLETYLLHQFLLPNFGLPLLELPPRLLSTRNVPRLEPTFTSVGVTSANKSPSPREPQNESNQAVCLAGWLDSFDSYRAFQRKRSNGVNLESNHADRGKRMHGPSSLSSREGATHPCDCSLWQSQLGNDRASIVTRCQVLGLRKGPGWDVSGNPSWLLPHLADGAGGGHKLPGRICGSVEMPARLNAFSSQSLTKNLCHRNGLPLFTFVLCILS